MSTLRGKPFPASIYEEHNLKSAHYRVFWALYNELGVDDEIPRYFDRFELARLLKAIGVTGITNYSAIIETLHNTGYIEARVERKNKNSTFVRGFEIRISPHAWTKDPNPRPVYQQKNTRAERKVLQQLRQANL